MSKDMSKDRSKDTSKDRSKDTSKNRSKDTGENRSEDTSKNRSKDRSKDTSKDTTRTRTGARTRAGTRAAERSRDRIRDRSKTIQFNKDFVFVVLLGLYKFILRTKFVWFNGNSSLLFTWKYYRGGLYFMGLAEYISLRSTGAQNCWCNQTFVLGKTLNSSVVSWVWR